MMSTLITLSIIFLRVFHPKALGALSSFLRFALNYQFFQYLFSLCVKIDIFVKLERQPFSCAKSAVVLCSSGFLF